MSFSKKQVKDAFKRVEEETPIHSEQVKRVVIIGEVGVLAPTFKEVLFIARNRNGKLKWELV